MRTNWAGNLTYSTNQLHQPTSVEALQELVLKSEKVRALGSRHCFNRIADSRYSQISLDALPALMEADPAAGTVSTGAALRYGQLCPYLHKQGLAIHNLASLPHISVAGACATGTHGSGVHNGNLSTAVTGMELVRADGELVQLSAATHPTIFPGAVVHLGALGIVTRLQLKVQPAFQMRQMVYQFLPESQLEAHFDQIMSAGYSVSLFTDWQSDTVNQVWIKERLEETRPEAPASEFFGAKLATRNLHPIVELSAENCTEQMGVPGPWYERLPHFRMNFTPSSGKELQTEFFVPQERAVEALAAMRALHREVADLLLISEIRTVAADQLWLSPAYGRPSVAIHFTWKQDRQALDRILPKIESALAPFDMRPHWGKIFGVPAEVLASRYEKMADFRALMKEYDPNGKFKNEFLESVMA